MALTLGLPDKRQEGKVEEMKCLFIVLYIFICSVSPKRKCCLLASEAVIPPISVPTVWLPQHVHTLKYRGSTFAEFFFFPTALYTYYSQKVKSGNRECLLRRPQRANVFDLPCLKEEEGC